MVAGHVMESDSVSVKVIEHGETELVTLPVVRLRPSGSKMNSILFPHMTVDKPCPQSPSPQIPKPQNQGGTGAVTRILWATHP